MKAGAHAFQRRGPWMTLVGLALLMILALAVRALGFEYVFVGDEVVFPPADAQYHLRRAYYTFVNFPAVLLFDPYINYPGGAPVPWPPLFDFLLGGFARLLADDPRGFETVAAWSGPVCALVTLVPIYAAGRLLGSRGAGLAAALCYAVLPVSVTFSRVGNPDHHAAVAMLGAWLLLACLGLGNASVSNSRVRSWGVLLALAQFGLLLTWHGSLLYLAIANALLLATSIAGGGRRGLLAQAGAALACGLALVPVVILSPSPLGGMFSSIALSWLHVLATLAVALVAAGLWASEAKRGEMPRARRLVIVVCGALVLGGVGLVVPEIREGLRPAFQFLSQTDQVGAITGEQNALFGLAPGKHGTDPVRAWGWFAYTIPFAPWLVLWLWASPGPARRSWAALGILGGWTLFFAALTLDQRRYGNDFGPAFSVLFGLAALNLVGRWRRDAAWGIRGRLLRASAVCALLFAFLWPVGVGLYAPRAQASWAALEPDAVPGLGASRSVASTLARFMADVRRATPDTGGYLLPGTEPEYGILAHANLGHALQYGARRATATDPFWWYIGPENWEASFSFLAAQEEAEALAWASILRGRYVLTHAEEEMRSVAGQLHHHDGSVQPGRTALGRFRLVVEAPRGGRSLGEIFRPRVGESVPYKLFEIVSGAGIRVTTAPGERVDLSLELRSNRGRRFTYRASARANDRGEALLRVPYATDPSARLSEPSFTRPRGLYRIETRDRVAALGVSESDVLEGGEIRLDLR
ncbi:MAG: glycosyltransferase family 39 protein [Myxococcota bacterium]|nr:glycosyltransferase family 39 protein [Myxococcota bacterium]